MKIILAFPGTICYPPIIKTHEEVPVSRRKSTLQQYFAQRVKVLENGCWEWQGPIRGKYGYIAWEGNFMTAHSAACILAEVDIPLGHMVHHKCSNTLCVNMAHLEVTTRSAHARKHWDGTPISVRGRGRPSYGTRWTCKRGHNVDVDIPSTVYIHPATGARSCAECRLLRNRSRAAAARLLHSKIRTVEAWAAAPTHEESTTREAAHALEEIINLTKASSPEQEK